MMARAAAAGGVAAAAASRVVVTVVTRSTKHLERLEHLDERSKFRRTCRIRLMARRDVDICICFHKVWKAADESALLDADRIVMRDGRDDFMEDMRECRPHGLVRDQDLT